ncbi:anillin-like isoform X2 [Anthonomus grandis grandis]|uniref:anillin-like isoform X2 n=1 Tax=Anthonomus grandis grandis TaxID=2921223 RepID=UPI00216692C0|nr:anillin-like isoform X2 [Anthonomus grandis grandis]
MQNKHIWSLNNFIPYKCRICKEAKNYYCDKIETTVALVHEPNWSLDKTRPKSSNKPEEEPKKQVLCQEHKLDKGIKKLESENALFDENKIESSGSSVDSDGLEALVTDHSSVSHFYHSNKNKKAISKKPKKSLYKKQNELYKALRQTKDRIYKVMVEASNALQEANKTVRSNIDQILVIQKVLLETGERVQLVNKRISDMSYAQINDDCPYTATITLSNIDLLLKPIGHKKKYAKYTERFLITISHGLDLFVSEFMEEQTDLLSLSRAFTFENVSPDFEIKVKLFFIRLKNHRKYINWKRLLKSSTSKIIYQDYVENQFQEKEVYKTSFQLCAEMTLTRDQIETSSSTLITYPKVFPRISGKIQHCIRCNTDTNVNISGFLDVGTNKGEVTFWYTRYCILKGNDLSIYSDPNDWQFDREPIEMINLSFCLGPITKKINNCSKPRCFQLTTVRPNNGSQKATLKSKPNFIQKQFYFHARAKSEYEEWTIHLDQLYHSLMLFKKLFFNQESEEYSKNILEN